MFAPSQNTWAQDHYFDKTDEATQMGILLGAQFLSGC
jgi:hypothetical protein